MTRPKPEHKPAIQGEGDYEAARRFDKAQTEFAHSGRVEPNARVAADALEREEAAARSLSTPPARANKATPKKTVQSESQRLEQGLQETFPASDPVSAKYID